MHAAIPYSDDFVVIVRWVARILAFLLAISVFFFAVGEINFSQMGNRDTAQELTFFIVWIGLIVALRWDGVGGAMITGGTILFLVLDYVFTGSALRFWLFLIFLLPGLSFLYCWWQTRRSQQRAL